MRKSAHRLGWTALILLALAAPGAWAAIGSATGVQKTTVNTTIADTGRVATQDPNYTLLQQLPANANLGTVNTALSGNTNYQVRRTGTGTGSASLVQLDFGDLLSNPFRFLAQFFYNAFIRPQASLFLRSFGMTLRPWTTQLANVASATRVSTGSGTMSVVCTACNEKQKQTQKQLQEMMDTLSNLGTENPQQQGPDA